MVEEHGGRTWQKSMVEECCWAFLGRRGVVRWRERKDSTGWFGDASEKKREELGWCFAGGRRQG
jgi:hypothetical protein